MGSSWLYSDGVCLPIGDDDDDDGDEGRKKEKVDRRNAMADHDQDVTGA